MAYMSLGKQIQTLTVKYTPKLFFATQANKPLAPHVGVHLGAGSWGLGFAKKNGIVGNSELGFQIHWLQYHSNYLIQIRVLNSSSR